MNSHMPQEQVGYVCVIDSDPAVRDSLQTLIDLTGHPVTCHATGESFWSEIERTPLQCVLCEAELPDVGGIELHGRLREAAIIVPFALLVSGNRPFIYQRAKAAGIDRIYRKPLVDIQELIEFIRVDP